MEFIHTYFNAKLAGIKALFRLAKEAWDGRLWLAVFGLTMLIIFGIVGAILLLPIDIIAGAVAWYADTEYAKETFARDVDRLNSI